MGGGPIISDNIIHNNISNRGAGIYILEGRATIRNNIFSNNYCWDVLGGLGGGICAYSSDLEVANNIFYQNTVSIIPVKPPPFPKYPSGGGLMWRFCSGTITNCVFVENLAATGENTYPQGCGAWVCDCSAGGVVMSNCIAWGNTGGDSVGVDLAVNYSLLQEVFPGTGNITGNPQLLISGIQFVLDATSPCIDAGDNSAPGIQSTDFSGMPRVLDGDGNNTSIVDMGANEFLMLSADTYALSESAGGSINLFLNAGPDDAFRNYLILGSVSGTAPGTPLPGGLILPLNWDGVTYAIWAMVNSPALIDFLGVLDAEGQADAQLNIGPLPAGSIGTVFDFAFTCNNPFNIASHPMEFVVVP
ncbi:MAG: right-handed parallel beta-helix repeat-containing protein [Planctomycetota bacterium]